MSEGKTIAITMSEAMWEDLVAALGRAGLDAPGPDGETLAEKTMSRLEKGGSNPLGAALQRITLVLKEDGLNCFQ